MRNIFSRKSNMVIKRILCYLLTAVMVCAFNVTALAGGSNRFSRLRVGDTVDFGSYEQDNNLSNGKEPIKWIVVETFSDCIKLVSQSILDSRAYVTGIWEATWENSDIRRWLNNEFYNTAFNYDEQRLMDLGKNHNQGGYYTPDRAKTYDMVWLMNLKEISAYFGSSDKSRICYSTEYARVNGVYTGQYGSSWWWTRTPGENTYHAAYVGNLGNIDYKGNPVNWTGGGIRPVILVSTTRELYSGYYPFGSSRKDNYNSYMYCSHCGSQIAADSKYCKYCGYPIK